jgi:hypothetical protein
MGAKAKLLVTLAVAGICGMLALPSVASAAARSAVTIHNPVGDNFKGFVFSPRPDQCADARTVKLFRQIGKGQDPKRDVKVARTYTSGRSPSGKHKWLASLRRPRPGNYYARVPATTACQADNSRAIHLSARPDTKIDSASIFHRTAYFHYRAVGGIEPYRFRCKLDDRRYRRCRGYSKNYMHLSRGHHVFQVFPVGGNGKWDPTPAKQRFRITS